MVIEMSDAATPTPPVTLEQAIAMVDAWPAEGFGFQLHEIARALRQGYDEATQAHVDACNASLVAEAEGRAAFKRLTEYNDALAAERDTLKADLADLQRTFDLRWDADQRAIKRWQAAHPTLQEVVWPDRADMVVWLLEEYDKLDVELSSESIDADYWLAAKLDVEHRALAAVPCARACDPDCACPDYRYAPCCNLRVALWPGEPFETDYLADSGEVHLFAPTVGSEPRASAGCVKLVEPSIDGWDMEADARRSDATLDAMFDAINSESSLAAHIANARGP